MCKIKPNHNLFYLDLHDFHNMNCLLHMFMFICCSPFSSNKASVSMWVLNPILGTPPSFDWHLITMATSGLRAPMGAFSHQVGPEEGTEGIHVIFQSYFLRSLHHDKQPLSPLRSHLYADVRAPPLTSLPAVDPLFKVLDDNHCVLVGFGQHLGAKRHY